MWQNLPYYINPVLIDWGAIEIRYYGLMYFVAFFFTYFLCMYRFRYDSFRLKTLMIDELLTYEIIGVLLGGRIGYFIFYNPSCFITNPLSIILPFEFGEQIVFSGYRGMSFHGGLLGVIISSMIFSKIHNVKLLDIADLLVPAFPLGYMFGRLGNFLNSELYGRTTDVLVGMYFPTDPNHLLRHPSQIYEAFGEGFLLFIILWSVRNKKVFYHQFFNLYLILYGTVRFFVEFFREPDAHIGYIFAIFSLGQCLCLTMVAVGIVLFFVVTHQNKKKSNVLPED